MERIVSNQLTAVVTVQLADREDGGLRVSSANLPGLLLSGSNKHEVCAQIDPAIRAIFEHAGYQVTGIRESTPVSEVIKKPSPREVDLQVHHFYVVELKSAA
jgi:hypothetical protein